jgi:hypothetical protein
MAATPAGETSTFARVFFLLNAKQQVSGVEVHLPVGRAQ